MLQPNLAQYESIARIPGGKHKIHPAEAEHANGNPTEENYEGQVGSERDQEYDLDEDSEQKRRKDM